MEKIIQTKNKTQKDEKYKFPVKSITIKDEEKLKLIDTIFEVDVSKIVESVREEVRNEIIQKVNELLIILKNGNHFKNQTIRSTKKTDKTQFKNVTLNLNEMRKQKMINSEHQCSIINNMETKINPQKFITIPNENQFNLNQDLKQILKNPKPNVQISKLSNINTKQNKNVIDVYNNIEDNKKTTTLKPFKHIIQDGTKINENLKLVK